MSIIQELHDSEIDGEVSWLFDGSFAVSLGNPAQAPHATSVVGSWDEVERWLIETAPQIYPDSAFAKKLRERAN